MKIYYPNDKFDFGKYKDEKLRLVYAFDPSYFEFLLTLKNSTFLINLEHFKDIHTIPLGVHWFAFLKFFNKDSVKISLSQLLVGTKEMKEYENPPSQPNKFIFSEIAIKEAARRMETYREQLKFEEEMEECRWKAEQEEIERESKYDLKGDKYSKYGMPIVNGEALDDDFIDDVLDGNPEAYWNID